MKRCRQRWTRTATCTPTSRWRQPDSLTALCREPLATKIAANVANLQPLKKKNPEKRCITNAFQDSENTKYLFPLIQSQFLIFPLIPMLCGFSIPACSANCSADLKENRKRAEQETFLFPALSALYPYYFFLSSSFCMLFSSLFAISLPYLSI